MRRIRSSDPYRVINLVFIGIILLIFAYSCIFNSEGRKHPLPSATMFVNNDTTIVSTGLSRSFSAIVRFDFSKARSYNPHGLRVFSFFALQLLMRITALVIAGHSGFSKRRILVIADITLSGILFVMLFFPFIRQIAGLG